MTVYRNIIKDSFAYMSLSIININNQEELDVEFHREKRLLRNKGFNESLHNTKAVRVVELVVLFVMLVQVIQESSHSEEHRRICVDLTLDFSLFELIQEEL